MSEKLPTIVKCQAGSTEQRKLVTTSGRATENSGRGPSIKCRPLAVKQPHAYGCGSIRNPWFLRCGVAFVAIVSVVIFVALYSKMHSKVQIMEVKLSDLEKKVKELEDRIHCSVLELNGLDSQDRPCAQYSATRSQRQSAGPTASMQNTANQNGVEDGASVHRAYADRQTTSAQKKRENNPEEETKPKSVYVAWGVQSCPYNTSTRRLYYGTAASSEKSTFLCLSFDFRYNSPEDISGAGAVQLRPVRYGNTKGLLGNGTVPCAVCEHTGRSAVLVQPAATHCDSDWLKAYHGYLMTSGNDFICVNDNLKNPYHEIFNGYSIHLTQYGYSMAGRRRPEAAITCVVCLK